MSFQPRDREYLTARVAAMNAAIEELRSSLQSPRERAALELLVETRDKMVEVLVQTGEDIERPALPDDRLRQDERHDDESAGG